MKPRTKPLLDWPSPSLEEVHWLKANGATKEGRSWVIRGDRASVSGGIPAKRLRLFVHGEVMEAGDRFILERTESTGALFLPQGLVKVAADRAGGMPALEDAVLLALEKYISMPGTGTINLMPPLSPEWQSIGATKIPARLARRLEELPFNLHAVLATAILTVNLLTAAPQLAPEDSETIYPSLPFRARHALARFQNKDRACGRVLAQFLEQDLGEIAAKVAETWLECNQLTSTQQLKDSRLTGGG